MKTALKIALIGVSGNVGQRILNEALERGHRVTGIARSVEGIPARENLILKVGDINDPKGLAQILEGHDVAIVSLKHVDIDPGKVIETVRLAGISRLLGVGGTATLEVAPGVTVLSSGSLPEAYLAEARAAQALLDALGSAKDLDWTVLSPAAEFSAGERTGKFRLDDKRMIIDDHGKSAISYEDFAIALLDEIEEPRHLKQQFGIGY